MKTLAVAVSLMVAAVGCTPKSPAPATEKGDAGAAAAATVKSPPPAARRAADEIRRALKEANPGLNSEVQLQESPQGVVAAAINDAAVVDLYALAGLSLAAIDLRGCRRLNDLRPLAGQPIAELYLEETGVEDIGPLAKMPLAKLYLSGTRVENLAPLAGAPLVELNLLGTRVVDLSPLAGSRLQMLWLNDTPVADIAPLARVPLVSLTLAGTRVADLSPLRGHPLQRLHIARTPVEDLSVLRWMRLSRLVFTPSRIKSGLEHARGMASLAEIGDELERMLPPAEFWRQFDAGKYR